MTTVTIIYRTPKLEASEGLDPADEFESIDDLVSYAGHDDFEETLNQAVVYYLYMLDARETGREFRARIYGSKREGLVLDDEEFDDYHQADIKHLEMEVGTLEDIRERACLESVDELLKRSLILYEKILIARKGGLDICLYDPKTRDIEWIFDAARDNSKPAAANKYKGPTLQ